jgi:hypothetical protein
MRNLMKWIMAGMMLACMGKAALAAELPKLGQLLTDEQVTGFARLALDGIEKEYPNKLSHVLTDAESARTPRELHPVFYGSFDWHSSVHGHWMLVRLLRLYPEANIAAETRALLARQFTADKLQAETKYFQQKSNRTFERMYGWAWALRLAQELRAWDDPQAQAWAQNFSPLEQQLVKSVHDYLPRLTYPIRTGVHPNTAFALALILDYARAVDDTELAKRVESYSLEKYAADKSYPANYEPSGHDFFSPGLNEADLLRRVMQPAEYSAWLEQFLPGVESPQSTSGKILEPAIVSDPSDPQIVHLAGLNLSRGWTQRGIYLSLPSDDPRRSVLAASAAAHCEAGLEHVFSGHYEGEHWLATFAVYLLTDAGITGVGTIEAGNTSQ